MKTWSPLDRAGSRPSCVLEALPPPVLRARCVHAPRTKERGREALRHCQGPRKLTLTLAFLEATFFRL